MNDKTIKTIGHIFSHILPHTDSALHIYFRTYTSTLTYLPP